MDDCYECPCGYVYDPADNGGKPFEDLQIAGDAQNVELIRTNLIEFNFTKE